MTSAKGNWEVRGSVADGSADEADETDEAGAADDANSSREDWVRGKGNFLNGSTFLVTYICFVVSQTLIAVNYAHPI